MPEETDISIEPARTVFVDALQATPEILGDTPLPDANLMMTENDMRTLLQTLINTTKSLDVRVTALESGTVKLI